MAREPSSSAGAPNSTSIEDRLAALEQASAARSTELRAMASELPAAVSRRSLLAGAARDLRGAQNKREIVQRGVRKLLRSPGAVVRRLVARR